MKAFADLLDRLSYEPRRNGKLRLMTDYFRTTPDPDRGIALAALTGSLTFKTAKPALVRTLIMERVDETLFRLSYDFVGDLAETTALLWPATPNTPDTPPALIHIVSDLQQAGKSEAPGLISHWLDQLDETGRWALLKLIMGGLRVGVSARLAKTAVAELGTLAPNDIEEVWHGLLPPYESLFAWAEGQGDRPENTNPAPFRPAMLAHPLDPEAFPSMDPSDYVAEWKWDGIRVQAVSGRDKDGQTVRRLFSRTGDDISGSFPDLVDTFTFDGALDGELLILRDGRVQPFNVLQQRLNRKTVSKKLMAESPAFLRAYDLLAVDGVDVREQMFTDRRSRLEALVDGLSEPRIHLSSLVAFENWDALGLARAEPATHGAGIDADAVEGLMIKRADSPYLPGRPKGYWYKWKNDPHIIDAVLMYAQRGHGKRSSFYSDFTFGVWRAGSDEHELVPVGKAYFGFTDEELKELDRFVRRNTINRFGPVREVTHTEDTGLVLEIAFEGLNRSSRHKSGVAMRFPRISRLRWDKPPHEADRLDSLTALLPDE
ncbi:cisplatin damage response ATP-dependent DNA ligase [Coralliovum pocilloporae]|uniref:cisplatin damage response ATP-dependent DNA ligase n=1 Tax=Coralliovum pocilloporae TaxID=3066369 RepID=UPI0033075C2A